MSNIKRLTILLVILSLLFVSCKKEDSPTEPGDETPTSETEVMTVSSTGFGEVSVPSGVTVSVIPGAVPQNNQGGNGNISFSIETPVTPPVTLGSNFSLVGNYAQLGPVGFNFRWPITIKLPYPQGTDVSSIFVVHYDSFSEKWVIVPSSDVEFNNNLITATAIELGYYAVATASGFGKVASERSAGGFSYQGEFGYFYTLTVASVSNFKYPDQQSWYGGNIVGRTGGNGATPTGTPLQPTKIMLPQAQYQIWITRTKPGTLSTLPEIYTYSVPATGTISGPVTYSGQFSTGNGWVPLNLPGGGTWVEGRPDNWAVATSTYGTGEVQITLTWVNNNSRQSDVDLHLFGPEDAHVYYRNKQEGGFELDRDWLEDIGNATENIYSISTIPNGEYTVRVNLYSGSSANFNVRVIQGTNVRNYSGQATTTNSGNDPASMVTIETFSK